MGTTNLSARIANLSPEKRALLEQRLLRKMGNASGEPGIRRRPAAGPCLLSFAQQRLWFLDQWSPGAATYNAPLAIGIRGSLSVPALRQALEAIVTRHEILRTTYISANGMPLQAVNDKSAPEFRVFDLRSFQASSRSQAARLLLRKMTQRSFRLDRDVMMRTVLVQLDEQEYILLFVVHHIAADGWSINPLFRELAALYEGFAAGKAPALPDLPIQYADYAVWQRQWFQGEVVDRQLAYWKEQLAGATPLLKLPTDFPRPAVQSFRGAHYPLSVPAGLLESVKGLSRQVGATLFMAFLGVFKTLLSKYTGQDDILVGTPIANRGHLETEPLIGFFVNTLVLRSNLSGDPTFRQLLGRIREMALGAYAHQDLPFEKLVEALRPRRDPSYNPIFQVNFRVLGESPARPRLHGLETWPVPVDAETSRFDLALELWPEVVGMSGYLEYRTDLFRPDTIVRMAADFEMVLRGVLAQPDLPISALDARPFCHSERSEESPSPC